MNSIGSKAFSLRAWPSAAALVVVLSCWAVEASIRVPFRGDVHPPESANVRFALSIARREPLYGDFNGGPFSIAVYPPLYSWIYGWIGGALGAGPDGLAILGRATSLGFALLAAIALAALLGREARRRAESVEAPPVRFWLAFALALSNPLLLRWALQARPDTMAAALSALGLWFGAVWSEDRPAPVGEAASGRARSVWAFGGVLLSFAAALGTKQTALSAPTALLAYLIWRGQARRALTFGVAMAVLCLAGLGFLRLAGGEFVFANLFANASVPYRLANIGRPLRYAMRDSLPALLLLGLWGAGVLLSRRRAGRERRPGSLMAFYLTVSFLAALAASGKSGSSMNYYLEFAMAAGAMGERALAWMFFQQEGLLGGSMSPRRAGVLKLTAGVLALLVILNLWARPYVWHVRRDELGPFRRAPALVDRLKARCADQLVLASDAYVALRLGKQPVLLDPFLFSAVRAGGGWRPDALHRQIRERKYALVVLDFDLEAASVRPDGSIGPVFQGIPFWPADTLTLLQENYRPAGQAEGFYLRLPGD